jgi:hypothetical protein
MRGFKRILQFGYQLVGNGFIAAVLQMDLNANSLF